MRNRRVLIGATITTCVLFGVVLCLADVASAARPWDEIYDYQFDHLDESKPKEAGPVDDVMEGLIGAAFVGLLIWWVLADRDANRGDPLPWGCLVVLIVGLVVFLSILLRGLCSLS
jgi:F0F1-type ATP synthase assembly protein I